MLKTLLTTAISMVSFALLTMVGLYWLPATVNYTITERYRFEINGESAISSAMVYLGTLLPQNGPYQTVIQKDILWDGQIERSKGDALTVVHLEGEVESGTEAIISFDVKLPQRKRPWDAPVGDFDLMPQPNIESDHPDIVAQAEELRKGNTARTLYRTYTFTAKRLNWPSIPRMNVEPSALTAYHMRVGGCNEFANLAVALYRANGTPAHAVSGLAMPMLLPYFSKTTEWMHPAGSHAWIEVQSPEGWLMADPSWASNGILFHRVYWGRNDGQHLAYGEATAHDAAFAELQAWAEEKGTLIGAMSGPNRFAAAANAEGVSITPIVTVQKGWDGRWFNVILLWALGIFVVVKFSPLISKTF